MNFPFIVLTDRTIDRDRAQRVKLVWNVLAGVIAD